MAKTTTKRKPKTASIVKPRRRKATGAAVRAKREAVDKSTIRCGDDDTACCMYMAMFRYVFGRVSYMPSKVRDVIMVNAKSLSFKLLNLLDRELSEAHDEYERIWGPSGASISARGHSNYGNEFQRSDWMKFHEWVKSELEKRRGTEEARYV